MSIGGYHSEQFTAASELLLAVAVTQKTIVANTFEAFGQDMDEETPNELPGVQRHYFLLASVAVILPSKATLPSSISMMRLLLIATRCV